MNGEGLPLPAVTSTPVEGDGWSWPWATTLTVFNKGTSFYTEDGKVDEKWGPGSGRPLSTLVLTV